MRIPEGMRLKCEFGLGDAIGTMVIWALLTLVTLGFAAFVAPYYALSAVVNRTSLVDAGGRVIGRLAVRFGLAEVVGHALIWLLLSIVTLGLALLVHYFMVVRKVLDRAELVPAAAPAAAAAPAPLPEPAADARPARPPHEGAVRR